MKVWLDGRLVPALRPAIAATDPAVLYGFGLFEVVRAYGGVPFRLADHLARMRASAKQFGLAVPDADLDRAVVAVCRANRLPDANVRITLTAGGHLIVLARPLEIPSPREYRLGAALRTVAWRHDPRAPLYGHKTLNYLENVRTRQEARAAGCADALMLGPGDVILEGCASNIFAVEDGGLVTPSLGLSILPGVTRRVVLDIAQKLSLHVSLRAMKATELARADEVFITGSTMEVVPVVKLDGRRVGGGRVGPVTKLVRAAYRSVVVSAVAGSPSAR
jgi:branched-chain amino acid aminotransferase